MEMEIVDSNGIAAEMRVKMSHEKVHFCELFLADLAMERCIARVMA